MTAAAAAAAALPPAHIVARVLGFPSLDQPEHDVVQPPELWRTMLLLHDYLDGKARLALFRSCRAGRDWVVQASKHMTLTLHTSDDMQRDARMAEAARHVLQLRGAQASSLGIKQGTPSTDSIMLLPDQLQGAGQHIRQLQLQLHQQHEQWTSWRLQPGPHHPLLQAPMLSTLMGALSTTFPRLHTLHLSHLLGSLPPRSQWPQLTDVNIDSITRKSSIRSLAAYLRQLTALDIHDQQDESSKLPLLFKPTYRTTTLQRLGLASLSSSTVDLLIQHAPALEQVTVHHSLTMDEDMSQCQWSLHTLILSSGIHADILVKLPSGPTVHVMGKGLYACISWLFSEGFLEKFQDRLQTTVANEVELLANNGPLVHGGVGAISRALAALSVMPADSVSVQLAVPQFTWPRPVPVLHAAAAAAAAHANLHLSAAGLWLTDEVLTALLDSPPRLSSLDFQVVHLNSDFSDRIWLWEQIGSRYLADAMLVRLPQLVSPQHKFRCHELYLNSCSPRAEGQSAVLRRLKDLAPMRMRGRAVSKLIINCAAVHGTPVPHSLISYLDMLWDWDADTSAGEYELHLVQWPLTKGTIVALAGLPGWVGTLDLKGCNWVEDEYTHYKALAECVPVTCKRWVLGNPPPAALEQLLLGVMQHWPRSAPLELYTGGRTDVRSHLEELLADNDELRSFVTVT